MNKVFLTGNLARDVELKATASGVSCVQNSIAVQRDFKDANGNYETDFINIVVWRQAAEYLNTYGQKGAYIELIGRWAVRSYTDEKSGQLVKVNECVADSVKVIKGGKEANKQKEQLEEEPGPTNFNDKDGLPF